MADAEGTPGKSMPYQGKVQPTGNKVHKASASELPLVHDSVDSPKGTQTNQACLPTDKQTLPDLMQSLSHQHAWKAQFVQKLGMDNLLTACIQTCGTVQPAAGDNAAQDAVQKLARTMKDHQLEFAQRTAKLAAAVLAAVLAFGKSYPGLAKRLAGIQQPETGQQLVPAHMQAAPAGSAVGVVMNDVSQALTALRHAAFAASKEQLEALNQAQQALDHAIHYVSEILDGLNQHAQALISSQALTPAHEKQLKSFLEPASTQSTTPTASTNGLNDVSVKPTATAMAPASTAGKQQDPAKGQQRAPEQGITAKQKRKRIEWDAQVAAATNAQTLRAAALAAHTQQVTASEAKAAAVKTPGPAAKKQKAPEHKSDPAAAGTKPKAATDTLLAKQSRQQPRIDTVTASSAAPSPSQAVQQSVARLAPAPSPTAKQQSSVLQSHASGKSQRPGTARTPDSKQPLSSTAATPDSKTALPDNTTAAASTLSAQALVESLPKTPPGTPPVTPTKPVARQPGSASKSEHEDGLDDNSVWQGDVKWQWGSGSAAQGGFTGLLTHVSSFPSGSRWNADSKSRCLTLCLSV